MNGDGASLDVQAVFRTLQGEGPYTGVPSVFIRLGGCNLACSFCDTEFESFSTMPVEEILSKADALRRNSSGLPSISLAVITGGEPLRQPISRLCELLLANGFKVQLETNGTLMRELPVGVEIVCSPKNTGAGYAFLRGDLLKRLTALKFLISAQDSAYNHVPEVGQGEYNIPVYLQPMDEFEETKNNANRELAIKLAMETGSRLNLQTHKILGLE